VDHGLKLDDLNPNLLNPRLQETHQCGELRKMG